MFQSLTMRGPNGSINWGYRSAATVTGWKVTKVKDEKTGKVAWTLRATLGPKVDRFQLRQRPLLFTAPRKGGFWCWPLKELTVGETTVTANLGPPEF
jgi:hypothetical protein